MSCLTMVDNPKRKFVSSYVLEKWKFQPSWRRPFPVSQFWSIPRGKFLASCVQSNWKLLTFMKTMNLSCLLQGEIQASHVLDKWKFPTFMKTTTLSCLTILVNSSGMFLALVGVQNSRRLKHTGLNNSQYKHHAGNNGINVAELSELYSYWSS